MKAKVPSTFKFKPEEGMRAKGQAVGRILHRMLYPKRSKLRTRYSAKWEIELLNDNGDVEFFIYHLHGGIYRFSSQPWEGSSKGQLPLIMEMIKCRLGWEIMEGGL